MFLRELVQLAKREGLIPREHCQPADVDFIIRLDPEGRCLGIVGTHAEPNAQGRRPSRRGPAKRFLVPWRTGRTSGLEAEFLVDTCEYVFGVTVRKDPKERAKVEKTLPERKRLFRDLISSAAEQTPDSRSLGAVSRFLRRLEDGEFHVPLPQGHEEGDTFGFQISGQDELVSDTDEARTIWGAQRVKALCAKSTSTCTICGETRSPVTKHSDLKPVPGANPKGAQLVSFNQSAFLSYGRSGSENAPVCLPCSDAFSAALNRLLAGEYPGADGLPLPRQRYVLSSKNSVAIFWSRPGDVDDIFADLLEGSPEAVKALLGSPWKGRRLEWADENRFFLVVLSGAEGRIILRDWFESSIRAIAENLKSYFNQIEIVRTSSRDPETVPLRGIVRSLAVQGKEANVPPNLAAALVEAALLGSPFHQALLERTLTRLRAESDFSRDRLALLKAILIRNFRKELNPEMDTQCMEIGYRLGRLFAVLERLQGAAIGKASATIVDRYYGAASTTPVRVFGRLLGLAQHHASKAPAGGYFQSLLQEILEPLEPASAFPSTLDMTQQGLFALGYYHQRAALWKKKDSSSGIETQEGETK